MFVIVSSHRDNMVGCELARHPRQHDLLFVQFELRACHAVHRSRLSRQL